VLREKTERPEGVEAGLALLVGTAAACAILVGWGMGRRVNGAAIVRVHDVAPTVQALRITAAIGGEP